MLLGRAAGAVRATENGIALRDQKTAQMKRLRAMFRKTGAVNASINTVLRQLFKFAKGRDVGY
jgi:chorismate mutase